MIGFFVYSPTSTALSPEYCKDTMNKAEKFLTLLQDFCDMGSAMKSVITRCLVNSSQYQLLLPTKEQIRSDDPEYSNILRSAIQYNMAMNFLPSPNPPPEFSDLSILTAKLTHHTFLEELVFWMVKYEFPQKLASLLLNMLPDVEYKEAFTRTYVLHYSRLPVMLVKSIDPDPLYLRVTKVSVQLFGADLNLVQKMSDELHLLHIMVSSLKNMMSNVAKTDNKLGDPHNNQHKVVDCAEHVMEDSCSNPITSDLFNNLKYPPIADRFMQDERLLKMWFVILSMFQGMNVNVREMESHIEFESYSFYASFSHELEALACPMWALVSHLRDSDTRHLTLNVITQCLAAIKDWFKAIYFFRPDQVDAFKVSFHLPLHRYFSVFVRQVIFGSN